MAHSLYEAIPIILDRFEFDKIEKVMELLNWNWYDGRPSLDKLRAEASSQLFKCVELFETRGRPASGMNVASGGFEATVQTFEKGQPRLQLTFYVDCRSSTGEY